MSNHLMITNEKINSWNIVGIADAVFQNKNYLVILKRTDDLYPDDNQFKCLLENEVEACSKKKEISYPITPFSNFVYKTDLGMKIEIIFEYFFLRKSIKAISWKTEINQAIIWHIIKSYR